MNISYREIPEMLHTINSEGLLIDVNQQWCHKMGYTAEEVLGRKSLDFLTAASRERAIRSILPYFYEKGFVRHVPFKMTTKTGGIIEVELSADLIRNPQDGTSQSRAILIDVTQRNQILRELLEADQPEIHKAIRSLGIY